MHITSAQLREAVGISPSYATMILNGDRSPPRSLAIAAYRALGWKHESIAPLSEEQIELLERVDPWVPPAKR